MITSAILRVHPRATVCASLDGLVTTALHVSTTLIEYSYTISLSTIFITSIHKPSIEKVYNFHKRWLFQINDSNTYVAPCCRCSIMCFMRTRRCFYVPAEIRTSVCMVKVVKATLRHVVGSIVLNKIARPDALLRNTYSYTYIHPYASCVYNGCSHIIDCLYRCTLLKSLMPAAPSVSLPSVCLSRDMALTRVARFSTMKLGFVFGLSPAASRNIQLTGCIQKPH